MFEILFRYIPEGKAATVLLAVRAEHVEIVETVMS